jgi:hypothetical protein
VEKARSARELEAEARHQRRAIPGGMKIGGDSQGLWLDRFLIGPVCCAVSIDGTSDNVGCQDAGQTAVSLAHMKPTG